MPLSLDQVVYFIISKISSYPSLHQQLTTTLKIKILQAIVSGGRRGEICIWDIRQRQLRSTMKAFDSPSAIVKCLCMDPNCDLFVAGSSEGDMKVVFGSFGQIHNPFFQIWTTDQVPRLFCSLSGEHVSKGGFSLRNIGSSSVQGVQQVFVDSRMNLLSIGADNSLKLRLIPPLI